MKNAAKARGPLSSSISKRISWVRQSAEDAPIRLRLNPHFFRTSIGIVLLIITAVVLLWALFAALRPLPGRDVSIATGTAGSAYAHIAERYREVLARNGVRLHLVPTNGAVENLERLRDVRAGVDAGFVQAGTTSERESPDLVSLGTVFYEPRGTRAPRAQTQHAELLQREELQPQGAHPCPDGERAPRRVRCRSYDLI
jgi:hypothetical protein